MRISDWSSDVCSSDLAADIARAKGRLDEIEALLARALPANAPPVSGVAELSFESSFGVEPYRKLVRHVQDYIAAGDCMQVVPSQRLSAPFSADPVQLYRAIRRLNPSPYLYCMDQIGRASCRERVSQYV